MLKTMLVGNVLYAAAIVGLWFMVGGDQGRFVPALIFATLAFFAGIATGIIGCQPGGQQKKIAAAMTRSRKRQSAVAAASALDAMSQQ